MQEEVFRNGDSTWSLALEEELDAGLKWWKGEIDAGRCAHLTPHAPTRARCRGPAVFLSRVPTFRDAALASFPSAHLHSATTKLPLLGFQLCTLPSPKRRLTAPLCLCLCAGRTRSLRCVRRPARVSARPAPSHHRSQSRDRETKRRRRSNAVGRRRRSRRRAVRGGGSGRRTYQFILLYIGIRTLLLSPAHLHTAAPKPPWNVQEAQRCGRAGRRASSVRRRALPGPALAA